MSPTLLEEAVRDRITTTGKKPKAIIPVHLYGMPAKIDEICAIAARYDIPVLEDAAEALGSEFMGRKCGTFGQFGVLSFNGNKMITRKPCFMQHKRVNHFRTTSMKRLVITTG